MHELTRKFMEQDYTFINYLSRDKRTALVCNEKTAEVYVRKTVDAKTAALYEKLQGQDICGLPRIIKLIRQDNSCIVIMEFVNGLPLDQKIERDGVVSLKEATKYMHTLCRCLKALHSFGIIHRDITASNIIIGQDSCYLIDLGIARRKKNLQCSDTQVLGTVGYAAPEQFGFEQSDERTDIYALGAVFNFMLTGTLPNVRLYDGKEKEIIKKCTAIDRKKRYQNIAQLEQALCKKVSLKHIFILLILLSAVCGAVFSLRYAYTALKNRLPQGTIASIPHYTQIMPSPNPNAAQEEKRSITLSVYEQIKNGMTYDDVVLLTGSKPSSTSYFDNMGMHYQTCTWPGESALASAMIMFQNGKVISKTQYGLK